MKVEDTAGWSVLAESARLGIVVDEHLVWSARDGTVGRPFVRAIQALAHSHVDVIILSSRPPAVVELLQRSIRVATWVSGGSSAQPWATEPIRVRLAGVPLIVIRAAPEGHVVATAVDGPSVPRVLGGSLTLLDFLWWVCRRRGISRRSIGSDDGPHTG